MDRVELRILYQDGNSSKLRCIVNKWKFHDAMMGEQYLTFTITSETPIDWAVGDFCVFRGETYTLNYVPSVTQKAGTKERQDAYTYENVKFESHQEELTRCIMLDITASTGLYIAALGTNYTGSSKFPLYCGETSVGGDTLTPVCALAAKMQANLDRMYGGANAWKIFVDTTTTFVNAVGDTVLVTHTDDKQLSFDNTTVAQALAEVHNTFDLDYCIRGRNIYIGYNLKNLTSDNDEETFAFGYGKGYPTHDDMNKGLFQIKRMANPQQKIVTRLRALGSTKNMPYRYYNKKYNLSQSLFPTNLQLPDTFETSATKATHNAQRDPSLSHVKGDTNDSYIDKNNNAAACAEGIREDCARWDGSNGDLVEIYPTIEGATYGELRGALVEDQDGNTGNGSFPNYSADERIDKLLAVGYKDGSTLVDDANKGDGILPESGISSTGVVRSADIGQTSLTYGRHNQFAYNGGYYAGKDHTLFTIQGVMPGKYAMAPTIGSTFFGFSLSCYRDGCSADVGFQIIIKQKNQQTGVVTTLATYTSDLVSIQRSDGVKEIELPELPDVVNGANAKVSEIRVTAMSDIAVTFRMIMRNVVMPSGFTDDFSISYKVGNSRLDHSVTYEPEYTWFPVDDSDSIVDRFHVFIQDMGFDLQACWSDETPMLVMKSGRCVGREFEILQDIQKVTHNNKKGYMLTLKRAEDSSLNTYYPSQTDPIAADDTFVLLGIQMPEAYVKMAEVRLLRAATQYLADNCETKFTYQPSIDDIYLQRNYDNMVQAGTPNKSIFWRLYAGLKFTFRGVPTSEDSPAPLADITIEKVTISMGEGLTPKVELTLNDDVQQGTIQKLTTSVDRIYNGSIFASGSGNGASGAMSAALLSLLQSEGEKLFLSKTHDDTAAGKITFNDVVTHNETLKAKKGIKVGNFQSRFLGSGALIDEEGNAEFESIYSRNFISTPEFRFNRITVTEGENWCTNGFGTIKEVEIIDDTTGYITLKLEENDYASIETGDICRGIYNDIANQYETASLDDDTELYAGENEGAGYGFSSKEGFFTSYFWVRSFVENKKGECKFMYELRNSNTPHPCAFMKFAQYGSFTNANRRSSSYSTSIGHYYEMVLDGVSTWKIRSANVVYRKGYLGNMTVTLKNGHEAELQGYGLYVQDNVYFGNAIVQLDPETLAEIEESLKSYEVNFSGYVDVITVDDVGNCIGGLWTVSGENNEYRNYRIHSAITVRKSGNLLILAGNNEDAGEGTFKIYAQPIGCTCVIENSTIYITGIDNIKDGVAGSQDDANFDYDAMRNMESCSVDIIIDCEGKGSIQKNFPIRIKHDSQPFVGADISNEFSAVSWNTQTQAYVGLPITFDMKMWHNNEILDIASANDISLSSATGGVTLVNGTAPATPAASSIYYSKSIITDVVTGKKHAHISINAMGEDLPNVIDIDITSTATYSGVSYERTLRHTINRSTDTNVYQLHPSVGEVGVIYNDNKQKVVNTNKVYTDVRCDSTDDKHYTVPTSDYATHGLYITYQTFSLDNNSNEVGGSETAYSNVSGVTVSTDLTRIRFKLYKLRDTTLQTLSALLDSTNVIEVLDVEDVPVILDGLDGDDSIQVILSNDSDSVMCVEDGTVIESTLPVTHACLMDGENGVGGTTLGTTLAQNKQSLGTFSNGTLTQGWSIECTNCSAEIVGWTTIDYKPFIQIDVKTVTDDTASVNVKCLYTKHGQSAYYSRLFTFNKLYGIDKHEIQFNPNSICYKANDDSYTPTKFLISIYKTTQEQNRHLMATLPQTGTDSSPVEGDYRLQYSTNKGSTWTTLTGYNSGVYIRESSDSGSGNKFSWDDFDSIEVRLQIYVGSEWILLDQECEDIVADGLDGKGVEYVFFAVSDWDGVEAHKPTIYDDSSSPAFQGDDHCPYTDSQHTGQWTAEPSGVGANQRYEFYAQRKKVNGVWQAFGTVRLWDRYAVDGVTPYMIDLSNEQSFVNCDGNGDPISGATYEATDLFLFLGSSYAFTDFTTIKIVPEGISFTTPGNNGTTYCPNGATPDTGESECPSGGYELTSSEKSAAQSAGYYRITPSNIRQASATITITATKSSLVLVTTYKINKNIAGGVGQDAVMYSLMPSLNVIHKNNQGTFLDSSLAVQVKKTVGTTATILSTYKAIADEGLTIDYQNSVGTTNLVVIGASSTSTVSVATSTFVGGNSGLWGLLRLKNSSGTIIDTERINVVVDGDDGADAHEVNPNILLRTIFNNGINFVKEAWCGNYSYISIDTASDTVIEGRKCVRINASSLLSSNYIDFSQDVYSRIKPNTWYTLSFNYFATEQFITYIYDGNNTSGVVDQNAGFYVDGTFVSGIGIDGNHSWPSNWNGLRHTLTFKTKSSFGTSEAIIIFRAFGGSQLAICMPKLEIGQVATAYMTHEDDLPGTYYYLTSDINSIIRTYTGSYRGSATPRVTAWKKVGGKDPQRLYDITDVNGQVAEGFTLNVYEMNGSNKEYTNTSSYGLVTCSTPHSDVDRFEAELVKDGKTYATLSIPIVTEQQGQAGADGVFPRDRGLFKTGETYYYKKIGDVFVRDMVRYEIGGVMYGFLVKDKTVGANGVTVAPSSASGDSNWEVSGIVETVIANTIFGSNANIGGFMASANKMASSSPAYRVIYRGTYASPTGIAVWKGDWVEGATYSSQESVDGYNARPVVYSSGAYWIFKQGGTTNNSTTPPPGNSSYWQLLNDTSDPDDLRSIVVSQGKKTFTVSNSVYHPHDSYVYTTEVAESDGIPKRHLVKYSGRYYVVKNYGDTVTSTSAPSISNDWRIARDSEVLAVVDDSTTGTYVDIPMFVIDGRSGNILMTQHDDTVFLVDETGRQILGDEFGQRVEIIPSSKDIKIFDSNNKQVIQFDGNKVDDIDTLFGNTSGTINVTDGNYYEYGDGVIGRYKSGVIDLGTFGSWNGSLNLVIAGTIRAQAYWHYNTSASDNAASGSNGGMPLPEQNGNAYKFLDSAQIEICVGYYENGSFVLTQTLASLSVTGDSAYKSIAGQRVIYGISSRQYKLVAKYRLGLYADQTQNYARVSWEGVRIDYAGGSYISRVFANGFVYGLNGANFMSAVAETVNNTTNMHIKAMSGGGLYGFEVAKDGLYVWISGTKYKVTVSGTNAVLTAQ